MQNKKKSQTAKSFWLLSRFGLNPQNLLWNKSEVSELKYYYEHSVSDDIQWWFFHVFQDLQTQCSDWQWNSFPQTLVSSKKSTPGECL